MSLKSARLKAGLTMVELEKLSGVSRATISRIEHGDRNIRGVAIDTALKLANACGVDVLDLLEDKEREEI